MHVDPALATRIETVISSLISIWANTAARIRPDSRTDCLPIAGGNAVFAGPGSPVTKATGIGMAPPVTEADFDSLEAFYRSRGAQPRLEVCPLAPDPLHRLLRARAYRLDAYVSTHIRPLYHSDHPAVTPPDIRIIRVTPNLVDTFSDTLGRGFSEGAEPPANLRDMPFTTFHTPVAACYLAFVGMRPAGAASLSIAPPSPAFPGHHRPLAALFGASTLPEFRRRGVQSALLVARLAHAAAAGCDLAIIHSRPGTPSERNIARAGFRLAYTKAVMSLD